MTTRAGLHCFREIGVVRSCFGQRFAIPRQAGLAPSAPGRIEIHTEFADEQAFRGLDAFSHVWVLWVFHANGRQRGWRPTVRPPRFHGRRRLGVFATRSPFRPNPVALSVVRLEGLRRRHDRLWLDVSGLDMLDGSPVLDIKPYLPYTDRIEATGGFAEHAPERRPVHWAAGVEERAEALGRELALPLRPLIEEILAQDPRSAGAPSADGFVMRLADCDLRWRSRSDGSIEVSDIVRVRGAGEAARR